MSNPVPVKVKAKEWGVSLTRVRKWCNEGRLKTPGGADGALKVGRDWIILPSAVKPPHKAPGRPRRKDA